MMRLVLCWTMLVCVGCSSWQTTRGYLKGYTDTNVEVLSRDFDFQYIPTTPDALYIDPNMPYDDERLARAIPYLRRMGVTSLDLSKKPFTDRAVGLLLELPNLEVVDLSGTRVTPAGLGTLSKARRLRELRLIDTVMSPQEISIVRDSLPGVRVVTSPLGVADETIR